jgi:hypothetical protein
MPIIIWLRQINIQSVGNLFKEKILAEVEDVGFGNRRKISQIIHFDICLPFFLSFI